MDWKKIGEVEREIQKTGRLSRKTAGDLTFLMVCDRCEKTVELRGGPLLQGGAPVPNDLAQDIVAGMPDDVHMGWDDEMTLGEHRATCSGTLVKYEGDLSEWNVH